MGFDEIKAANDAARLANIATNERLDNIAADIKRLKDKIVDGLTSAQSAELLAEAQAVAADAETLRVKTDVLSNDPDNVDPPVIEPEPVVPEPEVPAEPVQ